jgi:hypothetical protein
MPLAVVAMAKVDARSMDVPQVQSRMIVMRASNRTVKAETSKTHSMFPSKDRSTEGRTTYLRQIGNLGHCQGEQELALK